MTQKTINNALFSRIFTRHIPLLDVRAPTEFEQGAFPSAHNIPLLDNIQRAKVGTCYKQEGSEKAIALGHQLISGKVRQDRLNTWKKFTQQYPNGYLYCARGGMRSHIVQNWLAEQGINYPLISGGYKTLRRYLLETLEYADKHFKFIVLAGPTGSGKTHFLHSIKSGYIDLEKLANHRGSTFGGFPEKQPSQVTFENNLAIELLKAKAKGINCLLLEDESKLIGRCFLPLSIQSLIKSSPILLLKGSINNRVSTVFNDYIVDDILAYKQKYGKITGFNTFTENFRQNLKRISKRLGGERYATTLKLLNSAVNLYQMSNNPEGFRPFVKYLLTEYYDPMYHYQLTTQSREPLACGNTHQLRQWVNENIANHTH